MNTVQGQAPVEGLLVGKDSAQQFAPATNNFPDHIESKHLSKFPDRSILAKMVFFSCERCFGPLIPISSCNVCKKTSFRKCHKCGWKTVSGNHDSCECLISLSMKRTKTFSKRRC